MIWIIVSVIWPIGYFVTLWAGCKQSNESMRDIEFWAIFICLFTWPVFLMATLADSFGDIMKWKPFAKKEDVK